MPNSDHENDQGDNQHVGTHSGAGTATATSTSKHPATIPATAVEAGDSLSAHTYLGSIVVGGIQDANAEWANLSRFAHNLPKLGDNNWSDWESTLRTAIFGYVSHRGLGLLDGSIEGSVPAYKRYFGRPATDKMPASLATTLKATEFREREDAQLGLLILITVEKGHHYKCLGGDDATDLKKLGSKMYASLKAAYTASPMVMEHLFTSRLENFEPDLTKSLAWSIEALRNVFREKLYYTKVPVSEVAKVGHLLKLCVKYPSMADVGEHIRTSLMAGGDAAKKTFDDLSRQVVSVEQSRAVTGRYTPLPTNLDQQQRSVQYQAPPQITAAQAELSPSMSALSISPSNSSNSISSGSGSLSSQASAPSDIATYYQDMSTLYPQASQAQASSGTSGQMRGKCFHCGVEGHDIKNCEVRKAGALARDEYQKMAKSQERRGYRQSTNTAPQVPHANVWLPGVGTNSTLPSNLAAFDTRVSEQEEDATALQARAFFH